VVRQAEQVILAVVAVVAVVVVVVRAVPEALASSLQFHQKATVCAVAFFFPAKCGVLQSIGIPLRGRMHELFPFLDRALHASAATTAGMAAQRLIVAALLGGAIGVERQLKHRPAGLRTNMFMCFGSALFTIVSGLMSGGGSEDTRIAAQVVTGIGFIGAGVILHSGASVQGVTTAATIFVVAAIGMCAGAGLMFPATIATILVIFGLLVLGVLEQHVFGRAYPAAYQAASDDAQELYSILADVKQGRHTKLVDIRLSRHDLSSQLEFTLEAEQQVHDQLRTRLTSEFDSHKIISFTSSKQE
jgi:putative Mg2+ transporter-C (MgtC) family protein